MVSTARLPQCCASCKPTHLVMVHYTKQSCNGSLSLLIGVGVELLRKACPQRAWTNGQPCHIPVYSFKSRPHVIIGQADPKAVCIFTVRRGARKEGLLVDGACA